MSKFYWKLRAGGAFKPLRYQMLYIVTHIKPNNLKKGLQTYPRNRWGYGYWRNKGKYDVGY